MDQIEAASLTRRAVLIGLGAAGAAGLVPWTAEAAKPGIKGRIRQVYLAAGGSAALGAARANEVKNSRDGHNTYGQRFARGRVWWASGVGKIDLPASARVRLDGAQNFRPVLGVRNIWRANDLDRATALDQRIVRDLGVRTMIAFNGGSDPKILGVKNYRFPISNSGTQLEFYRGYVSRAASRTSIGQTLTLVASTTSPVLLHCQGGKDRTGWVSELLQRLAGVPTGARDSDYLATGRYSGGHVDIAWLRAAREQLRESYGDLEVYLTQGCHMTDKAVSRLRRRITPA